MEVASNFRPSKFLAQCSTQELPTPKFCRSFSQSTMWDTITGHQIVTYRGNMGTVYDVVWSPDGKRIASSDGSTLQVWDAMTGHQSLISQGSTQAFLNVAWSPESRYLALATNENQSVQTQVWDTITGHKISAPSGYSGWIFRGAWSPDGSKIVSASSDGWTALAWNVTSGKQVWSYEAAEGFDSLGDVMWSPDGKHLATGWQDGHVRIFNAP